MRRPVWPVVGLLVAVAQTGTAQRPSTPAVTIEAPRPLPVLPAALVPFTIARDLCQGARRPLVSLKVRDVLAKEVATLRLRATNRILLDAAPIGCGSFVAVWDGTIDEGRRLAVPQIYYLTLTADTGAGRPPSATRNVRVPRI